MTCCNHGCRQGRNCPALAAKVGNSWRDGVEVAALTLLLIFAVFCGAAAIIQLFI